MKLIQTKDYLLLIDEEAEIKEENIAIHDFGMGYDLEIPCDKDNLKSNTRKLVVAYYPLTKEDKELDLPLLPNPFKTPSVEVLADTYLKNLEDYDNDSKWMGFVDGYKAAQSDKQFSLEDVIAFSEYVGDYYANIHKPVIPTEELLNNFIQSLSTQQLPKEFIPEIEYFYEKYLNKWYPTCESNYTITKRDWGDNKVKTELKTITNSEGKEVLVGTYKY